MTTLSPHGQACQVHGATKPPTTETNSSQPTLSVAIGGKQGMSQ